MVFIMLCWMMHMHVMKWCQYNYFFFFVFSWLSILCFDALYCEVAGYILLISLSVIWKNAFFSNRWYSCKVKIKYCVCHPCFPSVYFSIAFFALAIYSFLFQIFGIIHIKRYKIVNILRLPGRFYLQISFTLLYVLV